MFKDSEFGITNTIDCWRKTEKRCLPPLSPLFNTFLFLSFPSAGSVCVAQTDFILLALCHSYPQVLVWQVHVAMLVTSFSWLLAYDIVVKTQAFEFQMAHAAPICSVSFQSSVICIGLP